MVDRLEQPADAIAFGPFRLLPSSRQLLRGNVPVKLGSRALDILVLLVERAGDVVPTGILIDRIWEKIAVEENSIRVHIAALRKALGDGQDGARYVVNVPGRGYCFVAPVTRVAMEGRGPKPARELAASSKLPPMPNAVIGREEITAAIVELVLSRRFVSVVGPGGIGKTTVAIAAATEMLKEFEGAVIFVDFAALTNPALVPVAVATAVGLSAPTADPVSALLAFLEGSRLLLVLDNCEHLIEAVATLSERLLGEAPAMHLLATSREVLRIGGEHVHLLAPLTCPADAPGLSAAEALRSSSVHLFMERARAGGYEAALMDDQAPVVARLCRSLDGLPLAIELAASRVPAYGLRGVADLVTTNLELLGPGRRTAMPRHQTLQAMLEWGYGLLPICETKALRRLSTFIGPFTLEAAERVSRASGETRMDVAVAVAGLVSRSLLAVVDPGAQTHYRLLFTTRIFAATKLDEAQERNATARRHAAYISIWLLAAAKANRDAAAYAPHLADIRSALEWSFSNDGDLELAVELAARAVPSLITLSLLQECEGWCERALAALPYSHRGTNCELALITGLAISSMFTRGNGEEVKVAIERGLALAETLGEKRSQLHLLAGLNIFLTRDADFGAALAAAERSSRIADELCSVSEIAAAESMLGVSLLLVGEQVAAREHCELSLQLMPASDRIGPNVFGYDHRARALVALARALWLLGLPDQALRVAQDALDEAGTHRHAVTNCITYIAASQVFLWCGRLVQAEECATRLVALATKHSLLPYRAIGIGLQGELLVSGVHPARAVELLRQSLAMLEAERHRWLGTRLNCALSNALSRSGQYDKAIEAIDRGLALAEGAGRPFDVPDLLRTRGLMLLAGPEPDLVAVEKVLLAALNLARAQSALSWELRTLTALAQLWTKQGRRTHALTQLRAVYGRFKEGFSTADLVVAHNLVQDLSRSVSAELTSHRNISVDEIGQ